jgi:acyl-phosphate glycerol 3-phosphate acyltransferase
MLFLINYIAGSLMFSYWLGRLARKDITKVGDGNPGVYNLFKSSGFALGSLGLALDYLKGAVPLYLTVNSTAFLSLSEIEKGIVASAPILGHAFSPFLKFRGGKAIAVSFGVWSALTLWKIPTLMGSVLTSIVLLFKNRVSFDLAPLVSYAAVAIYFLVIGSEQNTSTLF